MAVRSASSSLNSLLELAWLTIVTAINLPVGSAASKS
jgi:hypothetical protein